MNNDVKIIKKYVADAVKDLLTESDYWHEIRRDYRLSGHISSKCLATINTLVRAEIKRLPSNEKRFLTSFGDLHDFEDFVASEIVRRAKIGEKKSRPKRKT